MQTLFIRDYKGYGPLDELFRFERLCLNSTVRGSWQAGAVWCNILSDAGIDVRLYIQQEKALRGEPYLLSLNHISFTRLKINEENTGIGWEDWWDPAAPGSEVCKEFASLACDFTTEDCVRGDLWPLSRKSEVFWQRRDREKDLEAQNKKQEGRGERRVLQRALKLRRFEQKGRQHTRTMPGAWID